MAFLTKRFWLIVEKLSISASLTSTFNKFLNVHLTIWCLKITKDRNLYVIPVAISISGVCIIVIATAIVVCWRTGICHRIGSNQLPSYTTTATAKPAKTNAAKTNAAQKVQVFDNLSMAMSASEHTPPLSVRYGQWIGSIKENPLPHDMGVLTNLDNLDVMEEPVYNFQHQSLMYPKPVRFGNANRDG